MCSILPAYEENCRSGSIATLIHNVGTRCMLVFYFHLWEISCSTCWVKGCVCPNCGPVGVEKLCISVSLYHESLGTSCTLFSDSLIMELNAM